MKNEKDYINSNMKQRNPFQVPEGYFDTLTSRVMAQLPEKKAKYRTFRTWMYAAACVCAAVFSITVYFQDGKSTTSPTANDTEVVAYDNAYTDALMDYAMVDNQDIYACLTSE